MSEAELRERIRDEAGRLPGANLDLDQIVRSGRFRRRTRRVAFGSVLGISLLLIAIPGLVTSGGSQRQPASALTTAPPPVETPSTSVAAQDDCAGRFVDLPRLLLDTDALGLESFDLHTTDCPIVLPSTTSSRWLQAFRNPDASAGPMFWIETDEDGSDWFRSGEVTRAGVMTTWGDRTGFLLEDPLTFAFEDGDRDVVVSSQDASEADLRQLVEGLEGIPDGWMATELPEDVTLVSRGPADAQYPAGLATAEYQFEIGTHIQILIELFPGDRHVMEQTVYDMVRHMGPVTFGDDGIATASTRDGGARAVWMETEVVASVYINDTSTGITLEAVLSALETVDESDWQAFE